jgi:6-pyruvoyl-tetrahydropterin synthase
MKILNLSKNLKRKLALEYGNILISIAREDISDKELDSVLLAMFEFFKDIGEIKENNKGDEIMKNIKKKMDDRLKKVTESTTYTKEVNDRLYAHFRDDRVLNKKEVKITESIDDEFEMRDKTYEANLMIAIINSGIAEQSDINRIRSIAKDGTLTEAIKTIIPKRKHREVKRLVSIQEARYEDYLKRQRDLY